MNYGRNGHFLQSPRPEDRLGRYVAGAELLLLSGVMVNPSALELDDNGQLSLIQATADLAPKKGQNGLIVWETPNTDFPGHDPVLTRPSDFDKAPAGVSVQLVSAPYVRLRFINTEDLLFNGIRQYEGRTMVAGLGTATPGFVVGDLLTTGTGDDTAGYWKKTSDLTKAWFRVTGVYDTGELDAQMLF